MFGNSQRNQDGRNFMNSSKAQFKPHPASMHLPNTNPMIDVEKQGFGRDHHNQYNGMYTPPQATHVRMDNLFSSNTQMSQQQASSQKQQPTNDNRIKSEKFFKELQSIFTSQLDKLKEGLIDDMKGMKLSDDGVRKIIGSNYEELSENINDLKSDVKNAVKVYGRKLEESFKDQEVELDRLTNAVRGQKSAAKGKQSIEILDDSLRSMFSGLNNEMEDLKKELRGLKEQTNLDSEFIHELGGACKQYQNSFRSVVQQEAQKQKDFIDFLKADFKDRKEPPKTVEKQDSRDQTLEEIIEQHQESLKVFKNRPGYKPFIDRSLEELELQVNVMNKYVDECHKIIKRLYDQKSFYTFYNDQASREKVSQIKIYLIAMRAKLANYHNGIRTTNVYIEKKKTSTTKMDIEVPPAPSTVLSQSVRRSRVKEDTCPSIRNPVTLSQRITYLSSLFEPQIMHCDEIDGDNEQNGDNEEPNEQEDKKEDTQTCENSEIAEKTESAQPEIPKKTRRRRTKRIILENENSSQGPIERDMIEVASRTVKKMQTKVAVKGFHKL